MSRRALRIGALLDEAAAETRELVREDAALAREALLIGEGLNFAIAAAITVNKLILDRVRLVDEEHANSR